MQSLKSGPLKGKKQNLQYDLLGGYQPYYGIKGKTLKSGCGFFVKEGLKFKTRKDLDILYLDEDNEFHCCWSKILNQNRPNIVIGVYYRHPKKTSNNAFLEKLRDNLSKITNSNKTVIIPEDFNYILKYEHNKYITDFLNIMYSNLLQPCITEPTRIVGNNRPVLLDNIFINTYNKNVSSGNIIEKISYHMPNFVIIKEIIDKKKAQNLVIRDMKNFNKEQCSKDLENIKNL